VCQGVDRDAPGGRERLFVRPWSHSDLQVQTNGVRRSLEVISSPNLHRGADRGCSKKSVEWNADRGAIVSMVCYVPCRNAGEDILVNRLL